MDQSAQDPSPSYSRRRQVGGRVAAAGVDGDPAKVLQLLAPKLNDYMRRKGTTFEDVVARKRELRLAL